MTSVSRNAAPEASVVAANVFPKKYRLLKTDEYSSVFGFRSAVKSRHFLLHYRPCNGAEDGGARLGLVVAKRYVKRAVDRNLLRRLCRECFRLQRPHLPPYDFILRVACKPALIDRRAMAKEIRHLLNRKAVGR
ncbi:MAG TPA: ribonuclease P protein component [Accumulibacter sp.]|nr:ribonuclease P protein component [Accumulibacter sp.]